MANETIADIIAEIRREMPVYASGILCSNMTEVAVHEFADRIEASYKSELQAHVKNFESTINNLVDENDRLQAANARMREALLLIAGGKDARGNYEEVAWHMAQLAAEAIAAEGGAR